MWVSLQLLDQLSLQQLRCPQLALNAAIDSLLDHHLHNGSYHIGGGGCVSRDWFGKLLAAALGQFRIMEQARKQRFQNVACAAEQPAAGRLPALCVACGKEPHSLYADCCFKLPHMQQAGTSTAAEPAVQVIVSR